MRHKLVPALAGGALVAAALITVATIDPNEGGHYPTCPVLAFTGWWCPLCGGLRATHALLHGEIGIALSRNPLVPITCTALTLLFLLYASASRNGVTLPRFPSTGVVRWVLLGLAIFTVARNLPGAEWLSPV